MFNVVKTIWKRLSRVLNILELWYSQVTWNYFTYEAANFTVKSNIFYPFAIIVLYEQYVTKLGGH